jgi:hypothetical protein
MQEKYDKIFEDMISKLNLNKNEANNMRLLRKQILETDFDFSVSKLVFDEGALKELE